MKMSDVNCDVTFVDFVAGAVKNHDALVDTVAGLLGVISVFVPSQELETVELSEVVSKAKHLLKELGQ